MDGSMKSGLAQRSGSSITSVGVRAVAKSISEGISFRPEVATGWIA